jgi:hypothetical protein
MVPDLPFYVPVPYSRRLSHRFLGVVTVDLAAGLLVHEAWLRVVGPAVREYAPPPIGRRVTLARADAVRVVAALALGAATHVVWDAFTHGGTWGVGLVPALNARVGPLPAYEWAQYAGGAAGAAAIGWWAWRRRPEPVPGAGAHPRRRRTSVTGAGDDPGRRQGSVPGAGDDPGRGRTSVPGAGDDSGRHQGSVTEAGDHPGRRRTAVTVVDDQPGRGRTSTTVVGDESGRRRWVVAAVVALATVAGGAAGFRHGLGRPDPIRDAFYHGATWGADAGIIALVGSAALHRFLTRRR